MFQLQAVWTQLPGNHSIAVTGGASSGAPYGIPLVGGRLRSGVGQCFLAEDSLSPGVPNTQAGVYTESANDAALQFGIRFTTEQFHETKLLKLLSDANAPHYLYKEVM